MNARAHTLSPALTRAGHTVPTYLRVVVTARCNYSCSFCHMEGDPLGDGPATLPTDALLKSLHVALDMGIRKMKFLGGEPLLRRDLPAVIADLRARDPELDLSVITAGALPTSSIDALFDAGLSRANLSIHGFLPLAFAERHRNPRMWQRRQDFLHRLLEHGRPAKLNYVYTGPECEADLGVFLSWAQGRGAVVAILDDLGQDIGVDGVRGVLRRLLGDPDRVFAEPDPHSLPTERWQYPGLVIELKDHRLGQVAPWASCDGCAKRSVCGEGIYALRLTHDGLLRPCLDRPDLAVPLVDIVQRDGDDAARAAWAHHVQRVW